jgi:YHS domain-containing protein
METAIKSQKRYFGFALVAFIALVAAGCGLLGVGSLEKAAAVNVDDDGMALKGYDAVAYFNENKPVEGKSEFVADWNGAKWRFASAANRDAFQKEPAKYAPQYGGYCAWAVSQGYTADTDPNTGKVVGGKLYLNYNPDVAKKWNENTGKFIADGDSNWKNLAGDPEEARKDKK